ncbi:restriction endonuclease subunit S [Campylobacter concisus]|uniref:Restriction endonuclease subunit S n=1 Tax=Campylobacter concisus TaxID=199 RepID=A0A7S9ND86_9BACT|nr:restriction endonuclease subunit S [Campylobacter concisus]QPH83650.1 restriction endonuclease subunit S [Campylobacter concisus]
MAKFKRYDSYKNSGVEWLGEIPSHWEILANKYIFKLKRNLVGKRSNKYVLLSLTLDGIVERDLDKGGKFPAEFDTYQEVKNGDFVFCLFDVEETPRTIGLSEYDGMITGAYTVFDVRNVSKKYLYYFYLNLDNNKRLKPLYLGLRKTISKENFFSFKTFIPPKDEQEKIASYLDEKMAKIDASISGKEKFIELLKEQKRIIINDAVTKGLNKNAKFKNSGVEWLGEIPSHWEMLKLKFIGKIFAGLSDKKGDDFSKEFTSDKKPFIPFTNVCNNLKIDKNQMQYVKINPYETQNKVREKDIIFLMSSETLEDIGKCSIYLEKEQLYLNSFCKGFRPNLSRINPEFLNYLLQSKTYRNYFNLAGRGFTRINIKQEYISNLCAILPPKDEQEKIVEYIETKTAKIDKLVNLEQEYIKSLKEYKASLIDSVVTGKVKV